MRKIIAWCGLFWVNLILIPTVVGKEVGGMDWSIQRLQAEAPKLHKVYIEYSMYHAAFGLYAIRQGFSNPVERLATIVHEIIHVASAIHQGYYVNGMYYEPYLAPGSWPTLLNKDVMPYMLAAEKTLIYKSYMGATPTNNLGNVLDEVNAYNHVAAFVCKNEPQSGVKQVRNLIGLLIVVEAYLRVTRSTRPQEYAALVQNRSSAGALTMITRNAWEALATCGVPAVSIPRSETAYLASRVG